MEKERKRVEMGTRKIKWRGRRHLTPAGPLQGLRKRRTNGREVVKIPVAGAVLPPLIKARTAVCPPRVPARYFRQKGHDALLATTGPEQLVESSFLEGRFVEKPVWSPPYLQHFRV